MLVTQHSTGRQRSEGTPRRRSYYHAAPGETDKLSPGGPTLHLERHGSQGRDELAFLAHRWMGGEPRVGEWEMPLRQTYSEEYLRMQYAFKVLMIH